VNPAGDAGEIQIRNARSHNLRGVNCRIPLRALTVVTGVSGSGKSTLAFDTLYAEGQRRYVTSLSTYARQFLERLPRPDVELVSHLPPAIAIERRNRVGNARSTVGTATEIHDHLRLLFAHLGVTRCPECDRPVQPGTVVAVGQRIAERFAGRRISIGAPLPKHGAAAALRERLAQEGFARLLDAEGRVVDVTEISAREFSRLRRSALSLVDRLALTGEGSRARLAEAVSNAFRRGHGECVVVPVDGERAGFREGFGCDGCGRRFAEPEPALFCFNHASGACAECEGFGRVPGLDRRRVVADPSKSLARGAVVPFQSKSGLRWQARLLRAAAAAGVPTDAPFEVLDAEQQSWVFDGAGGWRGVQGYFAALERKRYRVGARVQIARYRSYEPCPACDGARLRAEALAVQVGGRTIADLARLPLGELGEWLEELVLTAAERERGERLIGELRARVATANRVGLDYMTLERQTRTLSGGEAQRMQLASALGGTLTATLYVLDEPSIGLHASDAKRLVDTLERIRDHGNTVVVVEHDPEIIAAADHVIDMGPGAGSRGGRVIAEGSVAEIRERADSPTGRALRGELAAPARRRRTATGRLRIVGARAHNLAELDVDVPLGQLVAVTGVSGAGKSTLVRDILVAHLRADPERGECTRIEGAESVGEVVMLDPAPPARSSRSNPATASKAFDAIRARFAATREARALGAAPGWFSFNVPGGRCESCEGSGEVVVDMQFLDDVRMSCETCDGLRYRSEVLQVRLDGLSIVDVLALGIDEACERFADDPKIEGRLRPLQEVGLGYLSLGQPLSTLSSGELQRLRLAQALSERGRGNLYVLDEPTTGLHPADVMALLRCIDRVIDAGASVIAVEHNLEVIRAADHVIDLGPGAGPAGGRVVGEGAPAQIARLDTPTGRALRDLR